MTLTELLAYTGSDGEIPPLQAGGVQEAVTVAAPTPGEPMMAADAKPEAPVKAAETVSGFVLLHVRGTLVMTIPAESIAVAFTLKVELIRKGAVPTALPLMLSEMDCTGQVTKVSGCEFTLPTEAKMEVAPGALAVAVTRLNCCGTIKVCRLTTLAPEPCPATFVAWNENGPTLAVMSALPANAEAWYITCSGPAGAPFDKQFGDNVGGWLGTFWITTLVTCW